MRFRFLRETAQAAKLRISVDGNVRMEELICDGALVSTPAGSTAYNLSAHGPILPIEASLLALTPISGLSPAALARRIIAGAGGCQNRGSGSRKTPDQCGRRPCRVQKYCRSEIKQDKSINC